MTSKIKVDNINKVSDDSTIIKKCGSTTTVGSGSGNTVVVCGSTVTIGRCGGTVALASGATQSGFGRSGSVNWQTGSIKTTTFTAANGEGYFVDTSSGAVTMNLPAGTAGAIVSVADYKDSFGTNNLTISPNGSDKIGGTAANAILANDGKGITIVYVDSTQGWVDVADNSTVLVGEAFISATGGNCVSTVATNFKVHKFTSPGTFCVASGAGALAKVDYLVVAGGGGVGPLGGGGGGAGGFRESHVCAVSGPYVASPLASTSSLQISPGPYSVTVGGGGPNGASGNPSIFSSITSAGGGHSARSTNGNPGGSGAGSGQDANNPGGSGNDPNVSPPQGQPGGSAPSGGYGGAGGGGGASTAGSAGSGPGNPSPGGAGGAGVTTNISGGPLTLAGGGGGGGNTNGSATGGAGGSGGGGSGGGPDGAGGNNGTANTGGGGGGGEHCGSSGTGGSGLVIIRYKFQ